MTPEVPPDYQDHLGGHLDNQPYDHLGDNLVQRFLIWLISSASTLAPYSFDQIQSLIVGQYTRPQSPVSFHFEQHDWQLNLGRFYVWWTISLVTPNTARSSLFLICSKRGDAWKTVGGIGSSTGSQVFKYRSFRWRRVTHHLLLCSSLCKEFPKCNRNSYKSLTGPKFILLPILWLMF